MVPSLFGGRESISRRELWSIIKTVSRRRKKYLSSTSMCTIFNEILEPESSKIPGVSTRRDTIAGAFGEETRVVSLCAHQQLKLAWRGFTFWTISRPDAPNELIPPQWIYLARAKSFLMRLFRFVFCAFGEVKKFAESKHACSFEISSSWLQRSVNSK